MLGTNLLTASQIADELDEPPQRITYLIHKYRLKPAARVGIIRLFTRQQIEAIKEGVHRIQIRRSL